MEIIKEINYDWMWKFGLALIGIGIILLVIFIILDSELSAAIGTSALTFGIVFFIIGIIQLNKPRFRVKLCDTYTVHELIEQCDSVKYESEYGTWLVRFKQDKDEKCDKGE